MNLISEAEQLVCHDHLIEIGQKLTELLVTETHLHSVFQQG